MGKIVEGFSKMDKSQKISWLTDNFLSGDQNQAELISQYWLEDENMQSRIEGFSENVISNYVLPFSIAPNFLINGEAYAMPMVIEESSVVAAASSAAKFWLNKGGFKAEVVSVTKLGHVHFRWTGSFDFLASHQEKIFDHLRIECEPITKNMEARGGGIDSLHFKNLSDKVESIYQLEVKFRTCDSMGANFINSVLEQMASGLKLYIAEHGENEGQLEVIMSILSNYTPECLVKAWVSCHIQDLDPNMDHESTSHLAHRFKTAVDIACADTYRAVTHNKGIFNGIDALVLATANDFRAIEACGHAYAARDGQYRSLSTCHIKDDIFTFELELPIACGTVGGLTGLHPLAKLSLEIMGNPSAEKLMQMIAVLGLAQNFAAVKSLVTTGIQKGHMKMHLSNILINLGVEGQQAELAKSYFEDKNISYALVKQYVDSL